MWSCSKKKKFVRFNLFTGKPVFPFWLRRLLLQTKKSYVCDTFIRLVENRTYHKRMFNFFFFFVLSYLMNFKSCSNPPKWKHHLILIGQRNKIKLGETKEEALPRTLNKISVYLQFTFILLTTMILKLIMQVKMIKLNLN